jgi:Zn-dependent membrane protease YugP
MYFLILIPTLIFSIYASVKVKSTFKKYSQIQSMKGHTGSDVARQLLLINNLHDVAVEKTKGELTDHYDPRDRAVRLSEVVHDSTSLEALGVAAHEVGHAIQDHIGYGAMSLRRALYPVTAIGSNLAFPLILIGIIFSSTGMLYAGIILFTVAVAFTIITLPVEFNASSRAMELLHENHFITSEEMHPTKRVLDAAAMTYVAAAVAAVMNLLYLLLIAAGQD